MKRIRRKPIEPTPGAMPVFAVPTEVVEVTASAAAGSKRVKTAKQGTKRAVPPPQRIGTAYALSDGSIGVQLTSIPLDGKLIVQTPRARGAQR